MPNIPPKNASNDIVKRLGTSVSPSFDHRKSTGIVNIEPAARDSPAEPMVCTILLSNIEFFLSIIRRTPIEITAAGIEAEIVKPTLRPK